MNRQPTPVNRMSTMSVLPSSSRLSSQDETSIRSAGISEIVIVPPDLAQFAATQFQPYLLKIKEETQINYITATRGGPNNEVDSIVIDAPSRESAQTARKLVEIHFRQRLKLMQSEARLQKVQSDLFTAQGDMASGMMVEFHVSTDLFRYIIGKAGVRIKSIEKSTNVKSINLDNETGKITVIGPDSTSVLKARELLELFEDTFTLQPAQVDFLLRNNGAILDIKSTSECLTCNIDRQKNTLHVIGTGSAVRSAKLVLAANLDYINNQLNIESAERQTREQLYEFKRQYSMNRGGGRGYSGGGRGGDRDGTAGGRGSGDYQRRGGNNSSSYSNNNTNAGNGASSGNQHSYVRADAIHNLPIPPSSSNTAAKPPSTSASSASRKGSDLRDTIDSLAKLSITSNSTPPTHYIEPITKPAATNKTSNSNSNSTNASASMKPSSVAIERTVTAGKGNEKKDTKKNEDKASAKPSAAPALAPAPVRASAPASAVTSNKSDKETASKPAPVKAQVSAKAPVETSTKSSSKETARKADVPPSAAVANADKSTGKKNDKARAAEQVPTGTAAATTTTATATAAVKGNDKKDAKKSEKQTELPTPSAIAQPQTSTVVGAGAVATQVSDSAAKATTRKRNNRKSKDVSEATAAVSPATAAVTVVDASTSSNKGKSNNSKSKSNSSTVSKGGKDSSTISVAVSSTTIAPTTIAPTTIAPTTTAPITTATTTTCATAKPADIVVTDAPLNKRTRKSRGNKSSNTSDSVEN